MINEGSANEQKHTESQENMAMHSSENQPQDNNTISEAAKDVVKNNFYIRAKRSIAVKSGWRQVGLDKRFEIILALCGLVVGFVAIAIYGMQLHSFNDATRKSTQTQIQSGLPMIEVRGPTLEVTTDDGSPVLFMRQDWTNTGETRASNVVVDWGWGTHIPDAYTIYQRHYAAWEHGSWVKSADAFDVTHRPMEEMKKFSTEKNRYLYGRVSYRDIFPIDPDAGHPTNKHLIIYCLRLTKFDISKNPVGLYGVPCDTGNCFDDMCPTKEYSPNGQ